MKLINETSWNGFKRHDYELNSREAVVVFPEGEIKGWVWRTEFFGAFAYADIEMVRRGYILSYYMMSDLFGAPCAVDLMNDFHIAFTKFFAIEYKPILFGFSRGGLYAFNYAAKYPERVKAMYLDAPVLDIMSWPGGYFGGEGSSAEWEKCIKAYGFRDEEEALKYKFCDRISTLVDAQIPIIIVAGDSDKVVPYEENAKILKERYEMLGGKIEVILKEGVGHHPHSLENPEQIVEFLTDV